MEKDLGKITNKVAGEGKDKIPCSPASSDWRGLVGRGKNLVFELVLLATNITTPPFCVTGNDVPTRDRTSLKDRMSVAKISKWDEELAVGIKTCFPIRL
jgi:hypothetical protein